LRSEKTVFKLFSHELAEDQLLGFLGDLLYSSQLRDSIESYDVNCKEN